MRSMPLFSFRLHSADRGGGEPPPAPLGTPWAFIMRACRKETLAMETAATRHPLPLSPPLALRLSPLSKQLRQQHVVWQQRWSLRR